MTSVRAGWVPAAAGVLWLGATAAAQTASSNPQTGGARKVQSGTEDAHPLLVSNPLPIVDMRSQTSFESVYTFEAADPMARNNGYFFRVAGAITAVFPRSVYVESRDGAQADIPPGTVFYIGGLPQWLRPEEKPPEAGEPPYNALDMGASDGAIDRSFGPGAAPAAPVFNRGAPVGGPAEARPAVLPKEESAAGEAVAPIPVSIWTNEEYRQHQVAALIKAAAAARMKPTAGQAGEGEEP